MSDPRKESPAEAGLVFRIMSDAMRPDPRNEDREDMMIISWTLLWDLTLHYPEGHERRQWAEAKIVEVDAGLGGRPGPPAGSARRRKIDDTVHQFRQAVRSDDEPRWRRFLRRILG